MVDLITRRQILLNEPSIKTVTGNGVSFIAYRSAAIVSCELELQAVQAGSGTPSTTNVRNIIGYDTFDVYHADGQGAVQSYSYSFATSRPKGNLDIVNGALYSEGYLHILSGDAAWSSVGSKFYFNIRDSKFQNSRVIDDQISNMYPFAGFINAGSAAVTEDKHFYLQRDRSNLNYCRIWVYDTDFTLSQFKEMLTQTPLQFTFPVEPYSTQLTAYPLRAFRGENRIWDSNNGIITAEYWTH